MSEVDPFPRHGLYNQTKRRAYQALLERQQGKCFICGVSHAELAEKSRDLAPVHRTLHIDHCHQTGMIRGLLCMGCNAQVGDLENYGFKPKPGPTPLLDGSGDELPFTDEDFTRLCESIGYFLEHYMDVVLVYMQPERWLTLQEVKQMAFAVREQERRDRQAPQQT